MAMADQKSAPVKKMVILYLLSFLWPAVFAGICEKCKCGYIDYYGKRSFATNCTFAGITVNDVVLLQYMPEETEVLIFTGNDVPVLPKNLFGEGRNFTNLRYIDMTANKIQEIKGKTFHHVPVVERLVLNHNSIDLSKKSHSRVFSNLVQLKELHLTNAFLDNTAADLASELHTIFIDSNLTLLEKLHLEQNEIKSFEMKKLFCDLKSLMDLHLGDNVLERLNFEVKCLPRLRYLDLEGNRISHFAKEDLQALDWFPAQHRQLIVSMAGNPFVCDCGANSLYSWVKRTKVELKDMNTISCRWFKNDSAIYLKDFNVSDCSGVLYASTVTDTDMHRYARYLLFSITFVLAAFLSFLSVKYSMEYCRHSVAPAGKVHYVVIQNQDENRVHLNKIVFNV